MRNGSDVFEGTLTFHGIDDEGAVTPRITVGLFTGQYNLGGVLLRSVSRSVMQPNEWGHPTPLATEQASG